MVEQEIFQLFMNQIPSLKGLFIWKHSWINTLTNYPETKDCLKNLSELHCNSDVHSDLFYQLSQICDNLLIEFISVQKKLRYLYLHITVFCNLSETIPVLY